jgi:hypothetical protein
VVVSKDMMMDSMMEKLVVTRTDMIRDATIAQKLSMINYKSL